MWGLNSDPPEPPPPPSLPPPFDAQVVLGFWKEFNLDGRRLQLDKQVRGAVNVNAGFRGFLSFDFLAAIMFWAIVFSRVVCVVAMVIVVVVVVVQQQ